MRYLLTLLNISFTMLYERYSCIIAWHLFSPSYISLEYALCYWGLIPEKVEEITSMTNKRNRVFETLVGTFSYKYFHSSKFSICDRLALEKDLNANELFEFLEFDLQLDINDLSLDIVLVQKIERAYKKKSVTAFFKWLK